MMALLSQLQVTEAIHDILTGRYELTDATRQDGVRQVRHYTGDSVFAARAPQGEPDAYVLLSKPSVNRFYHLTGEDDCCVSMVTVGCYSEKDRRTTIISDGVRVALTGYTGAVTMNSGTLSVFGCFIEDEGEQEPADEFDASADFVHQYFLTFRIRHSQVTPSGQA